MYCNQTKRTKRVLSAFHVLLLEMLMRKNDNHHLTKKTLRSTKIELLARGYIVSDKVRD